MCPDERAVRNVMDSDGRAQLRLTSNRLAEFAPDWLPDGRVVFVRCANDIIRCAFVAVEVGSGAEEVLHRTDGALFALSVSPGGDELAYTRWEPESERLSGDIYVVDLVNGNERRVTDSDANDTDGDWSPDGERLVFATDRDGNGRCLFHDCMGSKPELYVVDSDGSDPRRLTRTDLQETHPVWSPDGTRILFARIRDDDDDYELFVADADGTNAEQLTDNAEWDWQPDWWAPTRVSE